MVHLKREIARLDRTIDQAAERVLAAPEAIVGTLFRKLEEFKAERDRLRRSLELLARRERRSGGSEAQDVERAMQALDAMEETLQRAEPVAVRELLQGIVSRIVLRYEHGTRGTKLRTSRFERGEILTRPDEGCLSSQLSQLNTIHP